MPSPDFMAAVYSGWMAMPGLDLNLHDCLSCKKKRSEAMQLSQSGLKYWVPAAHLHVPIVPPVISPQQMRYHPILVFGSLVSSVSQRYATHKN